MTKKSKSKQVAEPEIPVRANFRIEKASFNELTAIERKTGMRCRDVQRLALLRFLSDYKEGKIIF